MQPFGKVITAMVTPFNEKGELHQKAAQQLVEHLIATGTDSLVVAGTTGEGPTLSVEEKLRLFEWVKASANEHPVIANIGSNNTASSIALAKEVEKRGIADGLLVVNPYYNKPSQEGLYQHFSAIAQSVNLPIMLYNIPGRTSVNLEADTCIRLAKIPNIVAVKEASGNLVQMARIIEETDDEFAVYSGDDALTLPLLALGGAGVVSVASHVVGEQIQEMITTYEAGNPTYAAKIHRTLLPFFEGIFFTTNPVPIKYMMQAHGIPVGDVRLPLVPLTENEKKIAQSYFTRFSPINN